MATQQPQQTTQPSPTLEQRRAAFALAKVTSVQKLPAPARAKYKTQLVKLPARLHTNGLGQTIAFYLAAGDGKPEWEICGWLEDWLRQEKVYTPSVKLIEGLTGKGVQDPEAKYRQAAAEVRALAVWLKRFAEAFLEGPTG